MGVVNRREFLRRALSLAPALVAVPAVTYFLPPRMGWPSGLLTQPNPDIIALICRRIANAHQLIREQLDEAVYHTSAEDWARGAQQLHGLARYTRELVPPEFASYEVAGVPVVVDENLQAGEWRLQAPYYHHCALGSRGSV